MVAPVQYATASEFDAWAAPSTAFRGVTTPEKDTALQWGARIMAGFIAKRKVLPLTTWGDDLKAVNCELASYSLMTKRGFRPDAGADENFRQRYQDAIDWLTLVSKGLVELVDCVDAGTNMTDIATPLVASDTKVNWDFQSDHSNRSGNIDEDAPGGGLG